tara:strand:- start:173 stop:1030 length:858 start_codon:yes stop_codon:yes gene_type:complete
MDESIYRVLHVKKNTKKNSKITRSIIQKVIRETHKICSFSTIPYFRHNTLSSAFSLKYYHSGNCIAMSMCAQQILKDKYNLYSFLIPASIPNKYNRPGYLDISHAALCIPGKKGYYIIDAAFYFLQPLYVSYSTMSKLKKIQTKNIYNNNEIATLQYSGHTLEDDEMLNAYQFIPKHTDVCTVYFQNDPDDRWNYYIIQVINPDNSIGRFFLHIRQDNFITITDELCNLLLYIKQTEQFTNDIVIKYKQNNIFTGLIDKLSDSLVANLDDTFKWFIPNGIRDALR